MNASKARRKSFSPFELSMAPITEPDSGEKAADPVTGKAIPFDRWAVDLVRSRRDDFSEFENEALELANKVWLYQKHRAGERLYVLPEKDSPDRHWISVAELMGPDFDQRPDAADLREAKEHFERARGAYLSDSPEVFREATRDFLAAVRRIGPELEKTYPRQITIDLEVAYNRWAPFSLAWIFSLTAFVCFVPAMAARWRGFSIAGLGLFAASLAVMLMGFGLRAAICGRVPVTNLYESVVFAAFGAMVFVTAAGMTLVWAGGLVWKLRALFFESVARNK